MKALIGSHCFGEQSVVMHWISRSCCRRLSVCSMCWFLFCWQKYYQRYSVHLQSKDADLKAVHHLKTSFDDVSDYCNNFTDVTDEATRICCLCGADPKFQHIRVAKRSVILMSWLKTRLINAEQRFRITVTSQLTQWFTTSEWNDFLWLNLQRKQKRRRKVGLGAVTRRQLKRSSPCRGRRLKKTRQFLEEK